MTDNDIEKYLAEAIEKNTPDMIDDLMQELQLTDKSVMTLRDNLAAESADYQAASPKKPGNRKWMRTAMSVAAVMMLVIGGLSIFESSNKTFAVVSLDVNPSVELTIARNEKVKEARAINEEGKDILSDMDLKGTDANTACNAIAGAMLTKGYLSNTSNSILVSVRADDEEKGREIEKELSNNLNSYLSGSDISPAIMGQYVKDDDSLESFAEKNGVSVGKASLIRNLLASGSTRMTEESLLKLSTQELIMLGQERNAAEEAITYGKADTSKYIGRDKAIEIALAKAGLDRSQVTGLKAEYDADDGLIIYEVEFTAGGVEYEYDIDASSGNVVKEESEKDDPDDDDMDDDRYDDGDDDDNDGPDDDDDDDDDDDNDDDDDDDDRYDDHDDDRDDD